MKISLLNRNLKRKAIVLSIVAIFLMTTFTPVFSAQKTSFSKNNNLSDVNNENVKIRGSSFFDFIQQILAFFSRIFNPSAEENEQEQQNEPLYTSPIELEKTVKEDQEPTDYFDEITVDRYETVEFKIELENRDNCWGYDITLVDDLPDGLIYDNNAQLDGVPLEPTIVGEDYQWEFYLPPSHTSILKFKAIVAECGQQINHVDVTAYNPNETATAEDEAIVNVNCLYPDISVFKTVTPQSVYSGEQVTWNVTLENTGDVNLKNVTVTDSLYGLIWDDILLNVAEIKYFEYTTNPTETTVNVVNAEGYDPVGNIVTDDDQATVEVCGINPNISVVKTVNPNVIYAGEQVTWNVTLENTGDVTLSSVAVTDTLYGVIWEDIILDVNEKRYFEYTTNPTETTINNVYAEGLDPVGSIVTDEDSATVEVICGDPDISVEKTVTPNIIEPGETVTWNITVINDGMVPLHGVDVSDSNEGLIAEDEYMDVGEILYFEYVTNPIEDTLNIVEVIGYGPDERVVEDASEAFVTVRPPCAPEVWVDDNWYSQSDVNQFNSDLIWQYDAFNNIQDAVEAVCECETVHVRAGFYHGQILINKSLSLLGDEGAEIYPTDLDTFTIDWSTQTYKPVIFAYAGSLVGNNVVSDGSTISVEVDGFEIDGGNIANVIAILYHNVETSCKTSIISNNDIKDTYTGVLIDGCSSDTTIVYNKFRNPSPGLRTAIMITSGYSDCEPENVVINYNYIYGAQCSWDIGVHNTVDTMVDARYNWWGRDDGPAGPDGDNDYTDPVTGRPADGFGDRCIGNVHFDPWWGVDALADCYQSSGKLFIFNAAESFAWDSSGDISGNIEYWWDFGDGYYSSSKNTGHLYNESGTYHASLRVKVLSYDLEEITGYLVDYHSFDVVVP